MELSHDDVLEIMELIDKSKVEFLEIEVGDTKITASKSGIALDRAAAHSAIVESQVTTKPAQIDHSPTPGVAPQTAAKVVESQGVAKGSEVNTGLVKVLAPVVGVFYRQSEPGAPPYVEVGSRVEEGVTLGLLEVMKMFSSVTASVAGEIVEILVENNEFVEFEQPLMLIRPES